MGSGQVCACVRLWGTAKMESSPAPPVPNLTSNIAAEWSQDDNLIKPFFPTWPFSKSQVMIPHVNSFLSNAYTHSHEGTTHSRVGSHKHLPLHVLMWKLGLGLRSIIFDPDGDQIHSCCNSCDLSALSPTMHLIWHVPFVYSMVSIKFPVEKVQWEDSSPMKYLHA